MIPPPNRARSPRSTDHSEQLRVVGAARSNAACVSRAAGPVRLVERNSRNGAARLIELAEYARAISPLQRGQEVPAYPKIVLFARKRRRRAFEPSQSASVNLPHDARQR